MVKFNSVDLTSIRFNGVELTEIKLQIGNNAAVSVWSKQSALVASTLSNNESKEVTYVKKNV